MNMWKTSQIIFETLYEHFCAWK